MAQARKFLIEDWPDSAGSTSLQTRLNEVAYCYRLVTIVYIPPLPNLPGECGMYRIVWEYDA